MGCEVAVRKVGGPSFGGETRAGADNLLSPTKGKGPFRSDVKSDYYKQDNFYIPSRQRRSLAPQIMLPCRF